MWKTQRKPAAQLPATGKAVGEGVHETVMSHVEGSGGREVSGDEVDDPCEAAWLQIEEEKQNAATETGPLVQVSFRVSLDTRRRLKLLAARDDRRLTDVLVLALGLYEDRYGRL